MTGVVCKYLTAPEEVWVQRPDLGPGWQLAKAPERSLCAWATYHPASAEKLTDTPPWLSRAALGGHLVKPEADCIGCPCFERGSAVE